MREMPTEEATRSSGRSTDHYDHGTNGRNPLIPKKGEEPSCNPEWRKLFIGFAWNSTVFLRGGPKKKVCESPE